MTLRLRPVTALGCILCHRGTTAYAASRRANMASTGSLGKIVLLGECGRLRPSACRPPRASPCSSDVRRHQGRCRCDPCRLPAARRVLGRGRAAPAAPGHRRQRGGSRMRAHHRNLGAVATAAEADAETAAVKVSALLRVGWTTRWAARSEGMSSNRNRVACVFAHVAVALVRANLAPLTGRRRRGLEGTLRLAPQRTKWHRRFTRWSAETGGNAGATRHGGGRGTFRRGDSCSDTRHGLRCRPRVAASAQWFGGRREPTWWVTNASARE